MDFSMGYTDQQEAFRREVRAWLSERVPRIRGNRDSDENHALLRALGRQLGSRGWLYPTAPVDFGGSGMSGDSAIIIAEELGAYDLRLPPFHDPGGVLAGQTVLVWGTEEQKRRMLPPIIRGEVITWLLATGPEGGSDLASTTTRALSEGDEYVVNGVKSWVQGAQRADFLWTVACTEPDGQRYHNLSWFMIPAHLPGITVRPLEILQERGEAGSGQKHTVYLEDVRVSAADLVGGHNNGWQVAQTFLALKHGLNSPPRSDGP